MSQNRAVVETKGSFPVPEYSWLLLDLITRDRNILKITQNWGQLSKQSDRSFFFSLFFFFFFFTRFNDIHSRVKSYIVPYLYAVVLLCSAGLFVGNELQIQSLYCTQYGITKVHL